MSKQTIELDCPPGDLRPGDLLPDIVKDTGLTVVKSSSRFFGWWTFNYSDVDEETWKKANPIIRERIQALYKQGRIRAGSW